jgi:hypothetical protein
MQRAVVSPHDKGPVASALGTDVPPAGIIHECVCQNLRDVRARSLGKRRDFRRPSGSVRARREGEWRHGARVRTPGRPSAPSLFA